MVQLAKQAEIMSNKYAVVCTNPPYMNKLEGQLKKFVVDNYKIYSGDLFSVFIYRNFDYCKIDGYSAFMTPFVWLFIKTYEALRTYIIDTKAITTLVQMEYSAFEEATVPICSFVLKNGKATEKALCFRLSDFKGGMEVQKQKVLEAIENKECSYFYEAEQANFIEIPGSPIAYWVSKNLLFAFNKSTLSTVANCCTGMQTGNNSKYVRAWYEVDYTKTAMCCEKGVYKRYNCGGEFRKWYGNHTNVVMWNNNGELIRKEKSSVIRNEKYFFKEGLSWKRIGSSGIGLRFLPGKFIFDQAGDSMFLKDNNRLYYTLAFLNSKSAEECFTFIAPTMNLTAGNMNKLPFIYSDEKKENIDILAKNNVNISKYDWDSFENSWDFKKHPLICYEEDKISVAYEIWAKECDEHFKQLKANEEELNRIFIDITDCRTN